MSTNTSMPSSSRSERDLTAFSIAMKIELRKLLTTRAWWILGIIAVAVGATITILTVAGSTGGTHAPLETFTGALTGGVQTSYMVTAIAGIAAVAGEYRHRTVTPSYLAVPDRGKLISAKLIVLFGYGAVIGLLVMIVCSLIAAPWLSSRGAFNGSLEVVGVMRAVLGGIAAIAILTALGVAIAALIHNQLAAVGGLMVYLFAIEPSVHNLEATRDVYPFLPGGAVQALTYTGSTTFGSPTGATLLNPWLGAAVLLAYALVLTAIAVVTTLKTDVT